MQKSCAYKFCYYNSEKNCARDEIPLSVKCEFCDEVWYHTQACQKWDKYHENVCTPIPQKPAKPDPPKAPPLDLRHPTNEPLLTPTSHPKRPPPPLQKTKNYSNLGGVSGFSGNSKIYEPTHRVMNNIKIYENKILGEGSYGKVVLGKECLTNDNVAIKIVGKLGPTKILPKAKNFCRKKTKLICSKEKYLYSGN
jgi:hypothetical protein